MGQTGRSLLPPPPPAWFPCSGQHRAGVSAPAAGTGQSSARAELAASLAAPHQRGVCVQLLRGLGTEHRGQPNNLILGLKEGEDNWDQLVAVISSSYITVCWKQLVIVVALLEMPTINGQGVDFCFVLFFNATIGK